MSVCRRITSQAITDRVCMSVCLCVGRPQEVITPLEDSVVTEVTQVLREWSEKWKQLFVVSTAILSAHLIPERDVAQ